MPGPFRDPLVAPAGDPNKIDIGSLYGHPKIQMRTPAKAKSSIGTDVAAEE
jgi:hypothetical protein